MTLLITNAGALPLTQNLLHTCFKHGISNILVVCLDAKAHRTLSRYPVTTFYFHGKPSLEKTTLFGANRFRRITFLKMLFVSLALERGYDILFVDSDAVFLDDPYPHLDYDCDLNIQSGSHSLERNGQLYVNTGFFFARSNASCISFFKRLLRYASLTRLYTDDQSYFNTLLKRRPALLSVQILDLKKFPNGKIFWEHQDQLIQPAMIHNNFAIGLREKISRFKVRGLWYLPEEQSKTAECFDEIQ